MAVALERVQVAQLEQRIPVVGIALERPAERRAHSGPVAEPLGDRPGHQVGLGAQGVQAARPVEALEGQGGVAPQLLAASSTLRAAAQGSV